MQVVTVPDVEMPAGHDWLLVERGERLTAYIAKSAMDLGSMAEIAEAIRHCRHVA